MADITPFSSPVQKMYSAMSLGVSRLEKTSLEAELDNSRCWDRLVSSLSSGFTGSGLALSLFNTMAMGDGGGFPVGGLRLCNSSTSASFYSVK